MQEQLEDTTRQLTQVEHINEDLEHRLEQQARRHLQVVRSTENQLKQTGQELQDTVSQSNQWKEKYEAQVRRTDAGAERLRRVEKELYRMHLRKYNVLNERRASGNGGETKSPPSSPFPPGFPVPQDVNAMSVHYTALREDGGNDTRRGNSSSSSSRGGSTLSVQNKGKQKQSLRIKDEERRAMARMKKSNMPCYVHGRVGCPCSAMAYETNVSEGLDSLACFLGLGGDEDGATSARRGEGNGNGNGNGTEPVPRNVHQTAADEAAFFSGRSKAPSMDYHYQTPELRSKSYSNMESPSGLSLPGNVNVRMQSAC